MITGKTTLKQANIICSIFVISFIIFASVLPIQAIHTGNFSQQNFEDYISFNEAYKVANNKINELGKTELFSIKDWNIIKDDDTDQILFYLFNLNPQGYIIVAPAQYIHPIIAYSFTSNTNIDSELNPLYNLLITDISYQIEQHHLLSNNVISEYLQEWNQLRQINEIQTQSDIQQWPPEGTTDTEGWIETLWHQSAPYNNFCPYDASSGARSVAGCPSITMAQILDYHRTTKNIQLNDSDDYYHNYLDRYYIDDDHETYDFPSFPTLNEYLITCQNHYDIGTETTDEDIAALIFACGVACTQVYSAQGSGTFGVRQAMDAYERFNCDNAKLYYSDSSDEVFNSIKWNIKHALPVHFAVVTPAWNAGHNLVIDGYNTDDYYHLNFGWGGQHNGWYHIPDELPYDLTVFEGVIVDIMNISSSEDLTCYGELTWQDLAGGSTVEGSFTLENTGDPASLLNWQIESMPSWGEWTINPENGNDLTPEDGIVTIDVSVIVPNEKNKDFGGSIEVGNINNPSDKEFIPITVSTVKVKNKIFTYEQFQNLNHPFVQLILKLIRQ